MKVRQEILLTDADKYLLSKPLPPNPCDYKCSPREKFGCCGCPEQREYAKAVKPYDEAGIYEYAEKIRSIGGIEGKIAKKEKKKDKLYNSLPVEIRNVYDDLKKERKLNNEH